MNRPANSSATRRIFGAALTIGLLTVVARLASFGREVVIAAEFGTSDALDAFLIAFLVPAFFVNALVASIGPAFIPAFMRARQRGGETVARTLTAGTTALALAGLAVLVLLIAAFSPLYLPLLTLGFDAEKTALTGRLLLLLSPFVLAGGLTALWTAMINAQERFALPALTPVLTPFAVIASLLLFGSRLGIYALALGVIAGPLAEAIVLGAAMRRCGLPVRPRWHGASGEQRTVLTGHAPLFLGALLLGCIPLADQLMAATLESGSVAALSFGVRLVSFAASVGTLALGSSVMPQFSRLFAAREHDTLRRTVRQTLWLTAAIAVPLTVVIMYFSFPIIRVLFERGSFASAQSALVADIQALFVLQLPFYLGWLILIRLLAALGMNRTVLWISASNAVLNVILNFVLMEPLGVAGIALATSTVLAASFPCLMLLVWRRFSQQAPAETGSTSER